jgi:hypothetical protein
MMLLKNQHPNVHACVPLNDGSRRYLEVYISKNQDKQELLKKGLYFKDSNLTVYPCEALTDSAKILNVKLSHLPLLPNEDVFAGLKQSLAIFGNILDIGITVEPNTGFFMGTGFAVLNIHQDQQENNFQTLSHQLSWCESQVEFFHCTWSNMPVWCRYCHQEGHTKFECSLSKARILCYNCHQQGHRSFECPRRRQALVQPREKPRAAKSITNTVDIEPEDNDSSDSDYKETSSVDSDIMSVDSNVRVESEEVTLLKIDQKTKLPALIHNFIPLPLSRYIPQKATKEFKEQLKTAYNNYHKMRNQGLEQASLLVYKEFQKLAYKDGRPITLF